jgi:alkanesulfonate monooxygenase SsuD/methylene tetrahydromethanopterin reductase-like flavin-dependent oxidoreductase (luciferase family)
MPKEFYKATSKTTYTWVTDEYQATAEYEQTAQKTLTDHQGEKDFQGAKLEEVPPNNPLEPNWVISREKP